MTNIFYNSMSSQCGPLLLIVIMCMEKNCVMLRCQALIGFHILHPPLGIRVVCWSLYLISFSFNVILVVKDTYTERGEKRRKKSTSGEPFLEYMTIGVGKILQGPWSWIGHHNEYQLKRNLKCFELFNENIQVWGPFWSFF